MSTESRFVSLLLTDPQEKKAFLQTYHKYTIALRPHERTIIAAILGQDTGADNWRFCSGITCAKCRKEITCLDFFLSSITHHNLDFIKQSATGVHVDDNDSDDIDVCLPGKEHGSFGYTCSVCGETMFTANHAACGYYLYRYPGFGGSSSGRTQASIRMSPMWYERIFNECGLLAKYPMKDILTLD